MISEAKKGNISELLLNLLNDVNRLQQFKVRIKPEIKECILLLVSQDSEIFDNMDENIKKIIKDNKINSKDVPELLKLIQNLYKSINKSKDIIKKTDPYKLTEKILIIIIALYLEYNNINNTDILDTSSKIIKSVITLVRSVIN